MNDVPTVSQYGPWLPTKPATKCPLCGTEGRIRYPAVQDVAWKTPGEWRYRWCDCQALWLDPVPESEALPAIYPPAYVTHGASWDLLAPGNSAMAKLRFEAKLEVLRRQWGYGLSTSSWLPKVVGAVTGRFPAVRRWAGFTVRFLPGTEGTLLDVGCGNGSFALLMQRLGWNVHGLEPDGAAARVARELGIEVQQVSLENADLRASAYDAVTMSHVLEHLLDPIAALRQLSAALRPGGRLVSISPNPCALLARWFGQCWQELDAPRHLVLLGPKALAEAAEQAGLEARVWTTQRNGRWVAEESLRRRWRAVPTRFANPSGRTLAWLADLLGLVYPLTGEEVVLEARKPQS